MKLLSAWAISVLVLSEAITIAQNASSLSPSSTPDQAALVEGSNAFAADLYAQLGRRDGNLFFSPESISTAFAMAYAGARGQTASEIAATFHFTLPQNRLHPAAGALLGDLNSPHTAYQLHVADALWAEKDFNFLEDYLKLTSTNYGAGLRRVDFKGEPEAVRGAINHWVEEKTENKITNLLPPGSVDTSTRLVLTNAIYFKGDWEKQFEKSATADGDFHVSAAESVKAPLMHLESRFSYFEQPQFQALAIPYKTGELSMIVLLPRERTGLPALEKTMTPANLRTWLGELSGSSKAILTLPKFKMTQDFELGGTLSAMGMPDAFEKARADFSGMTGKRDFWIGAAVHKAYIDVNEEGTEAAAATGIVMQTMAMAVQQPPIVFRADHPFVFLIRDNRSGGILFMGRVTDPTK